MINNEIINKSKQYFANFDFCFFLHTVYRRVIWILSFSFCENGRENVVEGINRASGNRNVNRWSIKGERRKVIYTVNWVLWHTIADASESPWRAGTIKISMSWKGEVSCPNRFLFAREAANGRVDRLTVIQFYLFSFFEIRIVINIFIIIFEISIFDQKFTNLLSILWAKIFTKFFDIFSVR